MLVMAMGNTATERVRVYFRNGATRRLENVRGEFSITALAYNIRRAISLVGVPALIAAAKA